MTEPVKIATLTAENVKRIKAVHVEPSPNGLTIVGGNNNQGKTSLLDAIAWALGGNKYRPSQAQNTSSVIPPTLNIKLSNGLIVERKGKNSDLKVTDPSGNKAGQNLLDSFVEEFAINLPKFMSATNKEKAQTLLQIIGVGDKLYELEQQEKLKYDERLAIGRIADQKAKFAQEQPFYPDAPKEPVAISELIQQQQAILAKNGENQRLRNQAEQIRQKAANEWQEIERLRALLAEKEQTYLVTQQALETAQKSAQDLQDESTEELEASIANIEVINIKVRANLDREKAEADAQEFKDQYAALTLEIEDLRTAKTDLLTNADLPLEGLSVEDGELIYNGQRWDNMSGSQQMIVSVAIVRKLKPDCGFVLLDKLEQMDLITLKEFDAWLKKEGLQAIATRVSVGDECSIIIEDGYVKEQTAPVQPTPTQWTPGKF